ncbi:hypothetical protein P0D72_28710 [Paraburkholderia sediminicola]|uniref:hypothetical protein n=1 Tax=Paraburkholderia sediminicola TaxID=458836 RepID=UPI0038BD76C1
MFRTRHIVGLACALGVVTAHAETPHLTLDDIDQLSRDKVVRNLKGEGDGSAQGAGVSNLSLPVPGPVGAAAKPVVVPAVRAEPARHAERVSFLGAYRDGSGMHVLYEFRNAIYPALVGSDLLNGWKVTKVDGYLVTVSEGKGKPWTEPIAGSSASPESSSSPALRALSDLSGPLPPSAAFTPVSMPRPGQ